MITMGTLGDRVGRRRLLLIGAAAFAAVSVAAAYSASPLMLIVARGVLGIAGATLAPSTLALISSMFRDARQRGQAIAVWATCQFVGGAAGPVLAGVLLAALLVGLGVPDGGARHGAAADRRAVRAAGVPQPRRPGGWTWPASGCRWRRCCCWCTGSSSWRSGAARPSLAVARLGARSPRAPCSAWSSSGASSGWTAPLLNLRLLRNRPFTAVLAALLLAGVALAGTGLLVTQYLQSVLGYSPLASAVLFAPMGLGIAARHDDRARPRPAGRGRPPRSPGDSRCRSLGCLLLTLAGPSGGLPVVMAGIGVLALGAGPLFALGTGLVIGSVPPARAGSAASMSETANYLGSSLGLALLGAIGASVYRGHMAQSRSAGRARLAAGGRGRWADGGRGGGQRAPPGRSGAGLLDAARRAFTSGLHVTGVVTAVIFAVIALLIAVVRPGRAPAEMPASEAPAAATDEAADEAYEGARS